ncbi:hypothetical protein FJO69_02785 [[Mycoplasma] falconis]|uniref:Uncharacterized protein n=1 Tax=[Mycoplasma] falconis TaxID=92403 RepID=A0A501X8J8_9BACT|nr:hypothetical protein [[Mycoplasma] falconis]TPE56707.1 hypothetical protein FJO69_02785 [[Mycoplasma] falconis]
MNSVITLEDFLLIIEKNKNNWNFNNYSDEEKFILKNSFINKSKLYKDNDFVVNYYNKLIKEMDK